MSEQQAQAVTEADASIRVSGAVRRRLLTIQYERKMAGVSVSFSEIIEQLLERAS